jgi:hypothetical protein
MHKGIWHPGGLALIMNKQMHVYLKVTQYAGSLEDYERAVEVFERLQRNL